jgi:PAS domain S-box-containing protein
MPIDGSDEADGTRLDDRHLQAEANRSPGGSRPDEPALRSLQGDEHFRAIFEGAAIGISLTNLEGTVIGSNQCLQDMLGYSEDELHGMSFVKFTHPDDVEADWNLLQEMIAGERTHYRLEKRYIRKDGEMMWVRLSISLVRTPDGNPQFVMAMVEDISARKLAEEALSESEKQLHQQLEFTGAITGSLAEGVCALDREGRVTFVNPAAAQMLGSNQSELLGQDLHNIIHMQRPDGSAFSREESPILGVLHSGETIRRTNDLFSRRDGTPFPIAYTVSALQAAGKVEGAVIAFHDVTAQRAFEVHKSAFLSAAAHDLKTPLTVIKGFAQSLQQRLERGDPIDADTLAKGLSRINSTASRMTALINQLLDATQIEMGEPLTLHLRQVDLTVLVREAVAEYQLVAQGSVPECRITVHTPAEEIIGMWDGYRLERVLANLLTNSVKYSPEGGDICVVVQRADTPEGAWAILTVTDHGLGIPAADLPRVFERFHRGANVAGRVWGTGVGLVGVRQIVEQHGGGVSVTSTEGEGTTVTVRLPLSGQQSVFSNQPDHGDTRDHSKQWNN